MQRLNNLPPEGGEESRVVLLATIEHLKKMVQREASRRRLAESRLAHQARTGLRLP